MKKAYLNKNEVMKVTGVSKSTAYKIINNLRDMSFDGEVPWSSTYEAQYIGKKVIPVSIFLKAFPNAKAAVRSLE